MTLAGDPRDLKYCPTCGSANIKVESPHTRHWTVTCHTCHTTTRIEQAQPQQPGT